MGQYYKLEGAPLNDQRAAGWVDSFIVDGRPGAPIRLQQVSDTVFRLESEIQYIGVTGLDERALGGETSSDIRRVSGATLPSSDLASVPRWLTWFTPRYGSYTPAALIHDRFISATPNSRLVSDEMADRYFRFMLRSLRVTMAKRWLMWAAVALRTRYQANRRKRVTVVLWIVAAIAGIIAFSVGAIMPSSQLLVFAAIAPMPASVLWGRQAGAGLIGAYLGVPWILPPALFVGFFYCLFLGIERLLSLFDQRAHQDG